MPVPVPVQSVERAAAIIRVLAAEPEPVTLARVADAVGLAKGTTHGLLKTLLAVGFAEQEPGSARYRIAPQLFRLGTARIDLNLLRSRAINWTDALAARSGEATQVAAFRDGHVVTVHHIVPPNATEKALGGGPETPLHASAVGKILLAHDVGAYRSIDRIVLDGLTFHTITNKARLDMELAGVRDEGWAGEVEECEPEIATLAAPIRDQHGSVVAAVGVGGHRDRICDPRGRPRQALITLVVRTGRSISRELGHGRSQ
ncbi:Glycerol operon regulatory protein [Mycolicibacterium vanbaalenii]|uniref:Glycerol operon regulatory protein n=1 Tax=Mycolicibacterium vanbaalenii TaxID=110539 RepID=A0A5S9R7P5_MYCVN|nr:Glycerol operon regulatory protein [Mycolicibacterium vanbaalenii]